MFYVLIDQGLEIIEKTSSASFAGLCLIILLLRRSPSGFVIKNELITFFRTILGSFLGKSSSTGTSPYSLYQSRALLLGNFEFIRTRSTVFLLKYFSKSNK